MTVEWRGDDILNIIAQAAIEASDETNGLIDAQAKGDVHVITGTLRRGIGFTPAKRVSKFLVSSTVGVFDVLYGIYEEILHPFLRPAYDRYAPTLDQRMAKRLKGKIK